MFKVSFEGLRKDVVLEEKVSFEDGIANKVKHHNFNTNNTVQQQIYHLPVKVYIL